jgi:hypothetical protein
MNLRTLLLAIIVVGAPLAAVPAEAKSCFKKASVGTALTEGLAKFQVDSAPSNRLVDLLQLHQRQRHPRVHVRRAHLSLHGRRCRLGVSRYGDAL